MRMRPILMSAPMVLATQADTKTVTRRLNGLDEVNADPDLWQLVEYAEVVATTPRVLQATFWNKDRGVLRINCPYGLPGDGLWVRENFRLDRRCDYIPPSCALVDTRVWFEADGEKPDWAGRLRPSIHIPRWISRLDLEISDIQLERLHLITEDDAKREGMKPGRGEGVFDHLASFVHLWDEINPKAPFERNNWVWVINFKRLIPFK